MINQRGIIQQHTSANYKNHDQEGTTAYFGLGHSIALTTDPRVFQVSLAGLVFGGYLVRANAHIGPTGRFLDLGTGSGVHALLMRQMGVPDVVASDISAESVTLARRNELQNFGDERVTFYVSDLFNGLPEKRYDFIAFNPPGWRTPSSGLSALLEQESDLFDMPPQAMFFGDQVVLRFLRDLPRFLAKTGTAIVGLNSLVGIRDVLDRYAMAYNGEPPLKYRLRERHSLPLLYYTEKWEGLRPALLQEFQEWKKQGKAAYTIDRQGTLYWSYEIVEFSRNKEIYE